MDLDDLLTLADAADVIGVPAARLRVAARDGQLPARRLGGAWVTSRRALEAFRREHAADLQSPDDAAPLTEMDAEGDDGQLYGG